LIEGAPSRGCLTTRRRSNCRCGKAIEARVKRLLEDYTAVIRDALSTPGARRKLSCDPEIAADLVVTFTRGLAVMEARLSQSQHLEKMSQQFMRILCRKPGAPVAPNRAIARPQRHERRLMSTRYRLRPIKPCISRFGSSVRNDFPNTPTLKLTDSVSGILPLPQQRLLRAQRFRTACEQRLHRVLDRGIEPPWGATTSTSPHESAIGASIFSAVMTSQRARPQPISRGNRAA